MQVTRTSDTAFLVVFESDAELESEYRTNLSVNGMRLPQQIPLYTKVELTLRGPGGSEVQMTGSVVAPLPDGVALMIEGDTAGLVEKLSNHEDTETEAEAVERKAQQTSWDRIRSMQRAEKIIFATKAERGERAILLQDSDPQVLQSLLKNPRLSMDEVVRIARSTYLTYQIAEIIMKTGQWMGNLDVRLALIQNAKTPPPFALRILPTLPDNEIRAIAKTATNMALKQAALRKLQGGG